MNFIIQTLNNKLVFDFCWELEKSIEYLISFKKEKHEIFYTEMEIKKGYIPVGSIEFSLNYYKKIYDKEVFPKNIPYCFFDSPYLGRTVINGCGA